MPSNCTNSKQSGGLYKPPHLRQGYINTWNNNNNDSKCTNKNTKEKPGKSIHLESIESLKIGKPTPLGNGESPFTKVYVPPVRRDFKGFGISPYFDCQFKGSRQDYQKKLVESTTLYVGNINLISTKSDIHKLFSKAGDIKCIIMGIEKNTLDFAGFCFIEYKTRKDTEHCMKTMQHCLLDGKKLFIDWDAGFVEGRQYARVRRNRNNKESQNKSMSVYSSSSTKSNHWTKNVRQ